MRRGHEEPHRINSIDWRRATLLGANEGINPTASLIAGVASAPAEQDHLRLDGSHDRCDVNGDRE
jgi:VIT1/CCC1 family predicted Fe2+/Mn2+ transporter